MRYLIDFMNTASDAEIQAYLTNNGCTVLKEWDNFEKEFLVECASALPNDAIIEHLVDDEDALAIKPLDVVPINNNWMKSLVPGIPTTTIQTQNTDDWWKNYCLENPVFDDPTTVISRKGSTIPVYVMDSGIKADHPDFNGVNITNIFSVIPNDYVDVGGHGTGLASIISGQSAGITNCPIKVVRVFAPNHNTLQSEFVSACDAIMADFKPNSIGILNCSFVMPRNTYIESKLRALIEAGIFVVCSAGNNGVSIEDVTPACMPEAFTIGAYDENLEPCDFSNYTGDLSTTADKTNHGELDGWAPGLNIRIAALNDQFGYMSGTSAATAVATAVLAHSLHDWINVESGERWPGFEPFPIVGHDAFNYSQFFMRRQGLLDLSDPKYAGSVNRIATITQSVDNLPFSTVGFTDVIRYVTKVGYNYPGPVISSRYHTVQMELLEPLPAGFTILPNAQLVGAPSVEQGPAAGEAYNLLTSKVRCTYSDGSTEEKDIHIYVTKPDFSSADVPEDHELNMVQAGICTGFPSFCGVTIATTCVIICPGTTCCNLLYKGAPCDCS